jgi:hypothetical protein
MSCWSCCPLSAFLNYLPFASSLSAPESGRRSDAPRPTKDAVVQLFSTCYNHTRRLVPGFDLAVSTLGRAHRCFSNCLVYRLCFGLTCWWCDCLLSVCAALFDAFLWVCCCRGGENKGEETERLTGESRRTEMGGYGATGESRASVDYCGRTMVYRCDDGKKQLAS